MRGHPQGMVPQNDDLCHDVKKLVLYGHSAGFTMLGIIWEYYGLL